MVLRSTPNGHTDSIKPDIVILREYKPGKWVICVIEVRPFASNVGAVSLCRALSTASRHLQIDEEEHKHYLWLPERKREVALPDELRKFFFPGASPTSVPVRLLRSNPSGRPGSEEDTYEQLSDAATYKVIRQFLKSPVTKEVRRLACPCAEWLFLRCSVSLHGSGLLVFSPVYETSKLGEQSASFHVASGGGEGHYHRIFRVRDAGGR